MQIQTIERYLILFDRFADTRHAGIPVEVTLDELTDTMICSRRNTKLILQKLEDEGLIEWLPGRGRGHRSRIAFRMDKEACLFGIARNRAENGDYKSAFELLGTYGSGTEAREKFREWMDGQFGYRQEDHGDGSAPCDTLVYPIVQRAVTIDPADVNYCFDAHLTRQVFDRLLRFDERTCKIAAGLAYHWTSSEDAKEWTFYLRKGIPFHDGRELSASDVVYSFERLRGNTTNRWMMRGVSEIAAASRLVVRIRLNKPNRIFDRFMCAAATSIVPAGLAGLDEADFWQRPIGTGPFRLVHDSSHRTRIEAFSSYYQGRPYLDRVDLVVLPEDFRTTADESPAPDVWHTQAMNRDAYDKESSEDWQTIEQLCRGCTMFSWNMKRQGPHASESFRQAVRSILNPIDMVEELGGDLVFPAFGFRPETSRHYKAEPLLPEQIRETLRQSAYDETPIRIAIHEKYKAEAAWIKERLIKWGIQVEVSISGTCGPTTEADCTIYGIVLAEEEVCEIQAYEHESCVLHTYLDDDRLDWIKKRIDNALAADNEEARYLAMRQIEGRLRDDASVIFLHHRQLNTYLHPSVRGVSKLNALGLIDFKDVWLEQLQS